ncbi:MAG: TonB-dependent receptor [Burkholderiales bacterium]|nr:TonB-dependent receptor [Burkholderiales bacterium]
MNRTFPDAVSVSLPVRKRSYSRGARWPLALCLALMIAPCHAGENPPSAYLDLSLEDLGNVRITSVSKKEERLADAAASVYVITEDAIRRSGARSLPEALRLAPNLQVAQVGANQYAISARGFNGTSANKLLVMIDGRTVYTPLYSGVFWDVQDVMLQDLDRIEMISGTGGALWGSNAVNGIVNVITRRAAASDGDLFYASAGTTGRSLALRHSGAINDSGDAYRLYAKSSTGKALERANGASAVNAWQRSQLGFRSDWQLPHGELSVQGDAYRGSSEQTMPGLQSVSGGNLLTRWTRQLADGANLRLQASVDRTMRDIPGVFSETLNTLDLDLQYSLPEVDGKQWIVGGGYRVYDDSVGNNDLLAFLPAQRKLHLSNFFVQQERSLRPDLQLIVSAKLEHNDYTGLEFLPGLKLAWKPADNKQLWASLARAVRTPSRIDAEFFVPGKPPYLLAGGPSFRSEIVNTVEIGWRAQNGQTVPYSVVIFHSEYDKLRSLDALPDGVLVFGNQIKGRVNGLEATASYQASKSLAFDASALLLREHFSGAKRAQSQSGNDPRSQWTLGSRWNIDESRQLDVSLRHVGKLCTPPVPAYTSLDARFGWRLSNGAELGLSGRNLFNPRHQEFASGSGAQLLNPILLERSFDLTLTVRF